MKYMTDRAWMEVDLDAVEQNYRTLSAQLAPSRIMAVVKADAYGLGAVPVARVLEQAGCAMFAVACIEEAMELRESGLRSPILTLGPVAPEHTALAARNRVWMPAISLHQAKALSDAAVREGVRPVVQIKVDVGLSRFGLPLCDEERAFADACAIFALPSLDVRGVFTQYTTASPSENDALNRAQIARFHGFCDRLRASGYTFEEHGAASDFTVQYPEARADFVRIAALLIGIAEESPCQTASFRARIYQIKELPAGTPVGYGPLAYTQRATRLGVVPVGYADGIRRIMAQPPRFLVRGKWAPVIGKICMDYLMLDLTDIPEAEENDVVTLFGRDGAEHCEAWELAERYPGAVGEVTSTLVARIPRFYTRGGVIVGRLDEEENAQ